MSEAIFVAVICEGPTERIFVEAILCPHFQKLGIYMNPTILTKKGENGGDVKYQRLYNDLETHLKQGHNHLVTTFFDFYGLKGEWPGYENAKSKISPGDKQKAISSEVQKKVDGKFENQRSFERFLPHFVMHEIEALYFSCPATLAEKMGVNVAAIHGILDDCGEPEAINHVTETSPSHRLRELGGGSFRKTTKGIAIAEEIGLVKIREKCPLFHAWISRIESLAKAED